MTLKPLLKWIAISLLALGNAVALGLLATVIYVRRLASGMMGRGPSPSELAGDYIYLIFTSAGVGLLALLVESLYWSVSLRVIQPLRHQPRHVRMMKLTLVAIPMISTVIAFVVRVL